MCLNCGVIVTQMEQLIKFRTWGNKIRLKAEYAFYITERLRDLGVDYKLDFVKKLLADEEEKLNNEDDYLFEVSLKEGDVIINKTKLFPENPDRQKDGARIGKGFPFENAFWIKQGRLHYLKDKLSDPLALYLLKVLEQELAVEELEEIDLDRLREVEEAFLINSTNGIVTIRQVGDFKLGNSRFFAKNLRKVLEIEKGIIE